MRRPVSRAPFLFGGFSNKARIPSGRNRACRRSVSRGTQPLISGHTHSLPLQEKNPADPLRFITFVDGGAHWSPFKAEKHISMPWTTMAMSGWSVHWPSPERINQPHAALYLKKRSLFSEQQIVPGSSYLIF
jgi:hypothetical protein